MSRSYSPWTAKEDRQAALENAWNQGALAAAENDCEHPCGTCEPCERPAPENPYVTDEENK